MTAAYDSASLGRAEAAAELADDDVIELVDEVADDAPAGVPAAPASGVKPLLESGARIADRDRAFRSLYDAHMSFVWRNLRRLGVAESDVEDKVQEVFVVAYRRWTGFIDRGHGPRAWLFQIVLRVASEARRHRRRHPVDPDGGFAQERQSVDAPQTAAIARKQALDLLDRALAAIDMDRRAVLVLHEIEQMTAPEIARTLEIPLNTVYSRLRVARIELEHELARHGERGGAQ